MLLILRLAHEKVTHFSLIPHLPRLNHEFTLIRHFEITLSCLLKQISISQGLINASKSCLTTCSWLKGVKKQHIILQSKEQYEQMSRNERKLLICSMSVCKVTVVIFTAFKIAANPRANIHKWWQHGTLFCLPRSSYPNKSTRKVHWWLLEATKKIEQNAKALQTSLFSVKLCVHDSALR